MLTGGERYILKTCFERILPLKETFFRFIHKCYCFFSSGGTASLAHLLLVLPLGVEASLDAFPGLLEGLPLGALGRVMGAHPHDVGTGENQHIGHYLWKRVREKALEGVSM